MKDGDGYGEIKYRAQHGGLVFHQFKDGRGAGRWEDAPSYQLRNILDTAGLSEAAKGVYDGWVIQTAGLGAVTQDFLRVPGGSGDTSTAEDTLIAYTKWGKAVVLKFGAVVRQDCVDILCLGQPLAVTDKSRNRAHGISKGLLLEALALFVHPKRP